jgi:hypothetical protein
VKFSGLIERDNAFDRRVADAFAPLLEQQAAMAIPN